MSRELLQQALYALEGHDDAMSEVARVALHKVLAAPQPEPAAWAMLRADGLVLDVICPDERDAYQGEYTVPLYASPPAAPAPAGMVMVPREPTPEQITAGAWTVSYRMGVYYIAEQVYRAMLAAAPAPAVPDDAGDTKCCDESEKTVDYATEALARMAAAAPAVPLTDERIAELWVDILSDTPASGIHETEGLQWVRLARAIEQAHGIGGGK